MDQEIHLQISHVLAGGVEMDFTVEVRAQVVGVGEQLPVRTIRCQPLEILGLTQLGR